MKSMTGYGRGNAGRGDNKISVIIRSVNSKQLDIKIRGLDQHPEEEYRVREQLMKHLERGTVNVYFDLPKSLQNGTKPIFNRTRFEAINSILLEIQKEYGRHLELSDILSTSDLFDLNHTYDLKAKTLENVVAKAIQMLEDMQVREGEKITEDMSARIKKMSDLINTVEKKAAESLNQRINAFKNRIKELLGDLKVDETRLAQEVVFYSEKVDVSEEILRCKSHFSQMKKFFGLGEPVGKRVLFLCQEIGREVNTIGAKCSNTDMTQLVVELKNELEKIREQAQNIQ